MPSTSKNISATRPPVLGHILAIEINDFLPSGENSPKSRSRVIPNILHLLDHIDKHRTEGNFYITADLMRDFPEVVSLVFSKGHEIGLCYDYRNFKYSEDIKRYRDEIEQITNQKVCGVMLKSGPKDGKPWLKTLAESGFSYCLTDFNPGPPDYEIRPVEIGFDNGFTLNVFPPSLCKFLGLRIDFGQAGKIRLYPYWLLRRCMRYFTHKDIPTIINFPLWEFDPHLPRQVLSPLQSLKSYGNLSIAEFKLTRLLLEFDFIKATRILGLEKPI